MPKITCPDASKSCSRCTKGGCAPGCCGCRDACECKKVKVKTRVKLMFRHHDGP